MATLDQTAPISKKKLWAARIVTGLAGFMLLLDGLMKVLKTPEVIEGTLQLGYPESVIVGLGIVLILCVALYLFPRTSVLGAVLLTGYLGGAIATHLRISNPMFTHTLFPVYVAMLIWGGILLRRGWPALGLQAEPRVSGAGSY